MLLYLNFLKHCLYGGMSFKVARDVTAMTHPTIIPSLVDDKKRQIVTKFASLLLNNQAKALRYDDHICIFISVMLYYLL